MYTVRLFPEKTAGPVKDVHGVGGGPITAGFMYDATEDFREAGIPFCRTHDIEYPFGAGEYVDIHCIFRDFDKDETDPASYNFTLTDEYLKGIVGAGAKPFYRLGASIEHQPVKLYIHPPEDPAKWGRVCSRIIAHYNDGWANGFHMGIEYWEFWNEPEIAPCWTGTGDGFLEFYAAAAPVIRAEHPWIKLGGCAFVDPESELAGRFLAAVKEKKLPMDFFSWHCYAHDPRTMGRKAAGAEALLRKHGFDGVESILNEWNYVVSFSEGIERSCRLHEGSFECAYMAAGLSVLQDAPVSKAMYYDVQMGVISVWNGVFCHAESEIHAASRRPGRRPGYYALYCWNELKKLGTQFAAESDCADLYLTAARGQNGEMALLLSYFNDDAGYNRSKPDDADFRIALPGVRIEAYAVDEERLFEPIASDGGIIRMRGNSTAFLRLFPA